MTDLISRQAAIDARRYTFGTDEFSLEAAYHDCKLVFDGITDDDSFQEADTGLILYYANEIIYALQEALEGKDTNVPTKDCISRQDAIDELEEQLYYLQMLNKDENPTAESKWYGVNWARNTIADMPSAEPKRGKWYMEHHVWICSQCGKNPTRGMGYVQGSGELFKFCPNCGADMRREEDE